tara:strand:- start:31673 stop:32248 length:576 start_codon:yes stop_codon:yes gene_type:complete
METLNDKKASFTKNLLLEAARELSETTEVCDISFKLVSDHAGISQRTMFRHFNTREEFLDTFTTREYNELDLPEIPDCIDKLSSYVAQVYQKFEEQPRRVAVLLSADLLPRVISTAAKARFETMERLFTEAFPSCAPSEILKTTANIRYVTNASSWRYYRKNFNFDLQTSIECAQMIVTQSLNHLKNMNTK